MKQVFIAEARRNYQNKLGFLISIAFLIGIIALLSALTYDALNKYRNDELKYYYGVEYTAEQLSGYTEMTEQMRANNEATLKKLETKLINESHTAAQKDKVLAEISAIKYELENNKNYLIIGYTIETPFLLVFYIGCIIACFFAISCAIYYFCFDYYRETTRLIGLSGKKRKSIFFGKTVFSFLNNLIIIIIVCIFLMTAMLSYPNYGGLNINYMSLQAYAISANDFLLSFILTVFVLAFLFWSFTVFIGTITKSLEYSSIFPLVILFVIIILFLINNSSDYPFSYFKATYYVPILGLLTTASFNSASQEFYILLTLHFIYACALYYISYRKFRGQDL